jgi:hypothetical protein
MPAHRVVMEAYASFVKAAFSQSPDVLADFGLTPRKARAQLTVEQKAAAVAKRAATREARHVMGRQQRKAVKGGVTGVIVTSVTVPHPQPVASGPSGPGTPATSEGAAVAAMPQIASPR